MSLFTSLSLFFPVYNEVAVLEDTIRRANRSLLGLKVADFELIIIDDGSTDGSGALADKLAAELPVVRVVHHAANGGYGAALQTGFGAATKEWVMYTDSDGQFDVADLANFERYVGSYDVMLGYRLQRQDHVGRIVNAKAWSALVHLLIGVKVRDLDCAFKVIRRSALVRVLPLEASGAVISAELLLKLKRAGYKFVQVGVHHYPRVAGEPSGAKPSVILKALKELAALRRSV
ncbi:glycosyltransferase family 2 protein [Candidatus Saccharibacteria bacterium]|nr:glycosyltransferase family 2 protein [Candidatus Saccharibacteria bacterium]